MIHPLVIPFPPSANRLWRWGKTKDGRQMMMKSAEYRAWIEEAARWIAPQRRPEVSGAYRLTIIANRPDRRRRDLGNLEKPISDALQSCGVIRDDCDAKIIHLEWSDAPPNAEATVSVFVEAVETRVAA